MTTIDEDDGACIHGVWPDTSCSICSGADARRAAAAREVVYWFTAQFESRLACGCIAVAGERIGRCVDEAYVCQAHGVGAPNPRRER